MNLSEYKLVDRASEGAWMDLLDPIRGEATGVRIKVRGYDAPEVIKASRDVDLDLVKSDKPDIQGAVDAKRVARAKAAIIEWDKFEWDDIKEPTSDNLDKLFADPNTHWIIDQIETFGGKRINLFPKASETA